MRYCVGGYAFASLSLQTNSPPVPNLGIMCCRLPPSPWRLLMQHQTCWSSWWHEGLPKLTSSTAHSLLLKGSWYAADMQPASCGRLAMV